MIAAPHVQMVKVQCGWCRCYPCQCARTCKCACGGFLVELATLTETVSIHNRTAQHAAWRLARERPIGDNDE